MHSKSEDFREFSSFVEGVRGAFIRLLECIQMIESDSRMSMKVRKCVSEAMYFARKSRKNCDFQHDEHYRCTASRTKPRFREGEGLYESSRAVIIG